VHAAECAGVLQWGDAVDFEGDGSVLTVGMSGQSVIKLSTSIILFSSAHASYVAKQFEIVPLLSNHASYFHVDHGLDFLLADCVKWLRLKVDPFVVRDHPCNFFEEFFVKDQ
jgi:hypothetical protein